MISQSSIVSDEVWSMTMIAIDLDSGIAVQPNVSTHLRDGTVYGTLWNHDMFFFDSLMIWQLSLQIPFHNITTLCLRLVLVFFNCFAPDWNVLTIIGVTVGAFGKHTHGLQRVKLIKTPGPR